MTSWVESSTPVDFFGDLSGNFNAFDRIFSNSKYSFGVFSGLLLQVVFVFSIVWTDILGARNQLTRHL